MANLAIFCETEGQATYIRDEIDTKFDFHNIKVDKNSENKYIVLCVLGLLNCRPEQMVEKVNQTMRLDEANHVLDYKLVKSSYIKQITIEGNSSYSQGMSY